MLIPSQALAATISIPAAYVSEEIIMETKLPLSRGNYDNKVLFVFLKEYNLPIYISGSSERSGLFRNVRKTLIGDHIYFRSSGDTKTDYQITEKRTFLEKRYYKDTVAILAFEPVVNGFEVIVILAQPSHFFHI